MCLWFALVSTKVTKEEADGKVSTGSGLTSAHLNLEIKRFKFPANFLILADSGFLTGVPTLLLVPDRVSVLVRTSCNPPPPL